MHIEYLYNKINNRMFKKRGTQILLAMYNLGLLDNNKNSFFLYKKIDKDNYMTLKIVSDIRNNVSGYTSFFSFSKNDKFNEINRPCEQNIHINYHLMNIDSQNGIEFNKFIDNLFSEASFLEISLNNNKEFSYFSMNEIFLMNEEFKEQELMDTSFSNFIKIKNKYLDIFEDRKILSNNNNDIARLKKMLDEEYNIINRYIFLEKNIFKIINAYYNKQKDNMRTLYGNIMFILKKEN